MRSALTMCAVAIAGASCLIAQTPSNFQQDFEAAVRGIGNTYAYFDTKATRWNDVPALYAADVRNLKTRDEFVVLLERVGDESYDPHAQSGRGSLHRGGSSGVDQAVTRLREECL